MNFKNLAENLIIAIVVSLIGGFVGYTASLKTNKQAIELLRPVIEQAIIKETTSISNEFRTEIKKLKTKRGSTTTLEITPEIKSVITPPIKADSIIAPSKKQEKRKKFLGLF